ncbi:hypothetical protein [Nannocystis pusilla]|uniref:hypothetical protein n=1 Tax=Nannocystis pusilla TaxID=889268 RepID=UPI003B807F2B
MQPGPTPASQHAPSGSGGHEPHPSSVTRATHWAVHGPWQHDASTVHTHASIAGSPHRVGSQQTAGGSPVVASVVSVLVTPVSVSGPVVVVEVDVAVSVVDVVVPRVVVGAVVVGSPVVVPGSEVVVEVSGSVAAEPDELLGALKLSVEVTSSPQADSSGVHATSARVIEASLRKANGS